jgi:2-dehydro-3-deoxyphosphogluconate aldolase / (4S)-4-hydroxy-2-oxoglutarate aldolase
MRTEPVFEAIARLGVVPVIVVDSADAAIPLADALLDGGLPLVEITFRTAAAAEAIAQIRRQRPEILIGAGTVVTDNNLAAAKASGAQFCIAPGLNPLRVEQARQEGMPFVPGVCTPSETEQAMALGCRLLKFSPAEVSGGAEMLKAMAATYAHLGVRYFPTGGVNTTNLASYLALDVVAAVGGTWIATKQDIAEGKWQTITDRCKQALEIVAKARGA